MKVCECSLGRRLVAQVAASRSWRSAHRRVVRSSALARVYRYPIDVIPTGIMLAVFSAQLAAFFCIENPLSVMLAALVLFPAQVNCAGMCHNHHHLNTFRKPLANRAFEVVMFLQLGMLPFGYTLHHNIGHHGAHNDQSSDPNRWRRGDGSTMGAWEFAWRLLTSMYPTVVRIGRQHPTLLRRFLLMLGVCLTALAALLWIDPLNAIVLFVLPLPPALLLQAQATYYQHAGLEAPDPLLGSRSALDPLYNLRTFNLGYHTAHHLRPALHWSLLPAFHEEIAASIPDELIV